MKSFDEYIKESYSFRLGGSQQKGFLHLPFKLEHGEWENTLKQKDLDIIEIIKYSEWNDNSQIIEYLNKNFQKLKTIKDYMNFGLSIGVQICIGESHEYEINKLKAYCTRAELNAKQHIFANAFVDKNDYCVLLEYNIIDSPLPK